MEISDSLDEKELSVFCAMLFKASQEAKASKAYHEAKNFLHKAYELTHQQGIESTFHWDIAKQFAEILFLTGDPEKSKKILDQIMENSPDYFNRTSVQILVLIQETLLGNYEKAIGIGCKELTQLGINYPTQKDASPFVLDLADLDETLAHTDIEGLIDNPELDNQRIQDAIDLMNALVAPAYFTDQKFVAWLGIKSALLSIQNGHCPVLLWDMLLLLYLKDRFWASIKLPTSLENFLLILQLSTKTIPCFVKIFSFSRTTFAAGRSIFASLKIITSRDLMRDWLLARFPTLATQLCSKPSPLSSG